VPRRPLALLKAVIAFGALHVPEKKLIDALWQDEEGDAAAEAYRIAVHRLRRLLGDSNCIEVQDGFLSLNFNLCWLDVNAFECAVEAGGECIEQEDSQNVSRVLQLYGGHFLPGEEEVPWTLSMRERLRSKFIAYVSRVGKQFESAGRFDIAADCYRRGVDADDLAEELYQGLMRCLLESDRRSEWMGVYRRLRQTLSVTLGISPSPLSERLFKSMRQEPSRQSPIEAKR
jgi:LuxR family transcriptional regulator, maltose regulon positive regulatory protein